MFELSKKAPDAPGSTWSVVVSCESAAEALKAALAEELNGPTDFEVRDVDQDEIVRTFRLPHERESVAANIDKHAAPADDVP